ncbi:response regulator [candidate division KSB1 bacterium]|nr:response regulator [candidate division KSB1 bacterium]
MTDKTKKKILIIDDEANTRHLLTVIFERQGYQVVTADSAVDVLSRIKRESPDLILLDLSMPEVDGITALKRIKRDKECQKIPVIILTGRQEIDLKLSALEFGAIDYLTKPFQKAEVIYRVQNILTFAERRPNEKAANQLKKDNNHKAKDLAFKNPRIEKQNAAQNIPEKNASIPKLKDNEIKIVNSVSLHKKSIEQIFADAKINLVPNDRFKKYLAAEIEKARGAKYNITVMSLDVNNLKRISQKRGKNLFKNILLGIRKFLRKSDYVSYNANYRILLILPRIHLSMAKILGEHIQDFVLRLNPDFDLEIKLASFPEDGFNETEILSMLEIGLEKINESFLP